MILSNPLISKTSLIEAESEHKRELRVAIPEFLTDQQEGAQARTADIGEVLAVDDHGAIACVDDCCHRVFEIAGVGAVDATLRPGNQGFAFSLAPARRRNDVRYGPPSPAPP